MGLILGRRDIELVAGGNVGTHGQGLRRVIGAEEPVAHRTAQKEYQGDFEHHLAVELHVGARGDVELEGVRVGAGYLVVEGVYTLKVAISSGPSFSDLLGSTTRILRENSNFGT